MIQDIDQDESNTIDYNEFLKMMTQKMVRGLRFMCPLRLQCCAAAVMYIFGYCILVREHHLCCIRRTMTWRLGGHTNVLF